MSGCQNPPPPRIQDDKGIASVRSSETDERKNNSKATQAFTHAEFHDWFLQELCTQQPALYEEYTTTFRAAAAAVTQWRKRFQGDRALWQRLFDKQGVTKEFVEACPIIDAVQRLVDATTTSSSSSEDDEPFTIVDLASGKGYLSMLLAEMLPPSKVRRFVLMDKAWPSHGTTKLSPHHMNWEHLCDPKYVDEWPIPLIPSKQDLKSARQRRNLERYYFQSATTTTEDGDGSSTNKSSHANVILLAVHLCGTLSLKAIDLFNQNHPAIRFFCLKPCCLPGTVHAKRHELFTLSNRRDGKDSSITVAKPQQPTFTYCFPAESVCLHGKWNKNTWQGPRRVSMKSFFDAWAENLFLGIAADKSDQTESTDQPLMARKIQKTVLVQTDGGYQNEFLFAQRSPVTQTVWEKLATPNKPQQEVPGISSISAPELQPSKRQRFES